MNAFDQYEVWFVTGAQLLYGGCSTKTQVGNNHPKYISNMPREGHIGDFLNSFQQK